MIIELAVAAAAVRGIGYAVEWASDTFRDKTPEREEARRRALARAELVMESPDGFTAQEVENAYTLLREEKECQAEEKAAQDREQQREERRARKAARDAEEAEQRKRDAEEAEHRTQAEEAERQQREQRKAHEDRLSRARAILADPASDDLDRVYARTILSKANR